MSLQGCQISVGADLRVCPNNYLCPDKNKMANKLGGHQKTGGHIGPPLRGKTGECGKMDKHMSGELKVNYEI